MSENYNSKMNINRLGMFDMAKGFAMMVVVVCHVMGYFPLKFTGLTLFYPFWYLGVGLMPAFFIMSGYNFRKRPMGKCIKQQAKFYIRPYIIFGLCTVPVYGVIHYLTFRYREGAIYETKNMFLSFLFGINSPCTLFGYKFNYEMVAIWFFLAMFFGWIILNLIMNIKNDKIVMVCVVVCVVTGYVLGEYVGVIPWCIPQGLVAVGYIYAGYFIKKWKLFEKKLPVWLVIIFLCMTIPQSIFGVNGITYAKWKFGIPEIIVCGINAYLFIKFTLRFNDCNNAVTRIIRKIGKYTYWIIPLHGFEMMIFHWSVLVEKLSEKGLTILAFVIQLIICIVIIIAGCYLFTMINKFRAERRREKNERRKNNG